MKNKILQQYAARLRNATWHDIKRCLRKNYIKIGLAFLVIRMMAQNNLSFDLQLSNAQASVYEMGEPKVAESETESAEIRPMNTSLLNVSSSSRVEKSVSKPSKKNVAEKTVNVSNLANTYSNMVYTDKDIKTKEGSIAREEKRQKQLKYVKQYAEVARAEMKKFGIPASITLAQGLLESNVGESKLATRNNNHFGMKCFSKSCQRGHCSNFEDDSHKDFFRIYKSSWESYRSHSMLLKQSSRYQSLFKLKHTDYKAWAYGLKKAGYATDSKYAEKLINLIEDLKLQQYDK
ncbi:MAG TPA: glucosaminidase domain-containing protein [Saprospiraceae bacterium]|nr:glucosaminidase domain-containing protein [Saprospiraceae bacterium]HMQ82634.1 glucosaminidase domain-containing protein [Saprospiraceae bacterium]